VALNLDRGDAPISFFIDQQHLDALDQLAHHNERSRSSELRRAVAQHLSENVQEPDQHHTAPNQGKAASIHTHSRGV
jgi:predicted transcriptional regulator